MNILNLSCFKKNISIQFIIYSIGIHGLETPDVIPSQVNPHPFAHVYFEQELVYSDVVKSIVRCCPVGTLPLHVPKFFLLTH